MPLSSTIVVTALSLCFGGDVSEGRSGERCAAAVDDDQLAGAVTGMKSSRSKLLARLMTEDLAHDLLRQTRSAANVASDLWWSEKEGEIMAEAFHPFAPPAAGATLASLMAPEQTIVSSGTGTATITTDIRMGQISMDGAPL